MGSDLCHLADLVIVTIILIITLEFGYKIFNLNRYSKNIQKVCKILLVG
jgi:hypothetical protein